MKLEKWALIAQVVGSAAIIVTLVVLVLGVRAISALEERQISYDFIDRQAAIAEAEHFPRILTQLKAVDEDYVHPTFLAFMDRYSLTFEDAVRWYFVTREELLSLQADFQFGERDFVRKRLEDILE